MTETPQHETTPNESKPRLPKGGKRTPQRKVEEAEREKRTLEMVVGGFTFTRIAEILGYQDASGAYRAYQRGLAKTVRPAAEEVRAQEEERLDHLTRVWLPLALGLNGQPPRRDAAEVMVKLLDRRSKMFGIDQPIKIAADVTHFEGTGTDIDREVEQLARALAASAGGSPIPVESPLGQADTVTP